MLRAIWFQWLNGEGCNMKDLSKYRKKKSRGDIITSVSITPDQHRFIKRQRLNLSMIVRDAIERLRKEEEETR